MAKMKDKRWAVWMAGLVLAAGVAAETAPGSLVRAEEFPVYSEDASVIDEDSAAAETESSTKIEGTYSVLSDWVLVDAQSTEAEKVYKQSGYEAAENTSTLTCSYLDTSYTVFEYEQLRDMLTNNLLYSNVDAQISTSAVYTDAKDYLYILTADDSTKEYRDIHYYVVGDLRCFCIEVREYRAEAEQMSAANQKTPEEVGLKTAQQFVWDGEE